MIAAILPCRSRAEQTVRNVRRLLATAGRVEWELWCVTGGEPELATLLHELGFKVMAYHRPLTYWEALKWATDSMPGAPLLVNLANDLLPGRHWLERGIAAYRARFGEGDGLMGFNDGIHGPEHSPHFLISRGLLDRYGGWPVWYAHNFGDTELCRRAQQDGCYGKAPWAVLYHDHLENGAADDSVYQEGRATYERDARLFEERKRAGWPFVPAASEARPKAATGAATTAASSSG